MAATNVILVPDIGDFKNVPVVDVLVKVGDVVQLETPLITLETEKATMDVPATAAGRVVAVRLRKGDKVSQGAPIVDVVELGADAAAAAAPAATPAAPPASARPAEVETGSEPTVRHPLLRARETASSARPGSNAAGAGKAPPQPAAPVSATPTAKPAELVETHVLEPSGAAPAVLDEVGFSRSHASPSVRQLARELGVDLARVQGSGLKARITHEDVKAYVKRALAGERSAPAMPAAATAAALPKVPAVDFAKFGPIEVKPLGRIQKIAGARLHASWVNLPHVTQFDEADITDLESLRGSLKARAVREGIRLTPLAFVLKACVRALAEYPKFASSLDAGGENLVYKKYVHLGFAADTPNGLVVPVIRDADRKDIYEIARELGALSAKARDGKLLPGEMQGAVFTVSSLGSIGGTAFTPIINAPEVAILGVSRAAMKPVYQNGSFVPRLMLPLSLSYDHRVIDGADAVRFTALLVKVLSDARALTEAIP